LHSELCEKGDLGRLLDGKATSGLLTESDIWEIVKQLLPTIHFMHSRGVLHMDIKPANIYVTCNDVMKLGDFGTSVCRELWKQECDIHEGDAHYLAVEVLRDHMLSPAADIFSFGMTLHRLVTGYCVGTSYLTDKSSFLKNPRFTVSNQLATLIMSMIHPNFQERARADQLMSCLGLLPSPSSSPRPSLIVQDVDDDVMSFSSTSDQPSPSSSSCSSSSSTFMMITKQSELSPPVCSRRIVLSPKTPTVEKTKRKRRIGGTGRPRSLRDL
jgi:serine/threonine protein kinase